MRGKGYLNLTLQAKSGDPLTLQVPFPHRGRCEAKASITCLMLLFWRLFTPPSVLGVVGILRSDECSVGNVFSNSGRGKIKQNQNKIQDYSRETFFPSLKDEVRKDQCFGLSSLIVQVESCESSFVFPLSRSSERMKLIQATDDG